MDIKQRLIQEIEKIDDQIILEQLTALLKESDQNYIVEFSEEQIKQIKQSQQQIKEGKFHIHEDVMNSI